MRYPFERHVLVCIGGRCNDEKRGENRGELIRAELKDLNKSLGRKELVRVCGVTCLDMCDDGPNMVVWPGGEAYNHLTIEAAKEHYLRETADLEGEKKPQ